MSRLIRVLAVPALAQRWTEERVNYIPTRFQFNELECGKRELHDFAVWVCDAESRGIQHC